MMGTVIGRLGAWHLLFTYTNPTSHTHSFPLKKAFTGQEVATGAAITLGGGVITVGAGVITEGAGVITEGAGVTTAGAGVITVGAGVMTEGVDVAEEELEVAVAVEEAAFETAWLLLEDEPELMMVVVEEVLTEPFTHLPLERIRPSLLEQVLQPTPPSLKVSAKEEASQEATQLFPLATNPALQLAQTLPGSTPTAT